MTKESWQYWRLTLAVVALERAGYLVTRTPEGWWIRSPRRQPT